MTTEELHSDPFKFEIIGFKRFSRPFFVLILISSIFSFFGNFNVIFILSFLQIVALIFIFFPNLYLRIKLLRKLPIYLLEIRKISWIFNLFPGVSLTGEWFIESHSERRSINSVKEVITFIANHWVEFFVINASILAVTIRMILFFQGDPSDQYNLLFDTARNQGLILGLIFVPFVMAILFVWLWVWEDAELKVYSIKTSTKGLTADGNPVPEITQLWLASASIKNLLSLVFGLSALVWVADQWSKAYEDFTGGLIGAFVLLFIVSIIAGGMVIFMGVMYYRSGVHEQLVNDLRTFIREQNESNPDFPIKIAHSSIIQDQLPLQNIEEKQERESLPQSQDQNSLK